MVESMHVLFTLFSEFKANQHFAQYGGEEALEEQTAAAGGAFAPKNDLMVSNVPAIKRNLSIAGMYINRQPAYLHVHKHPPSHHNFAVQGRF